MQFEDTCHNHSIITQYAFFVLNIIRDTMKQFHKIKFWFVAPEPLSQESDCKSNFGRILCSSVPPHIQVESAQVQLMQFILSPVWRGIVSYTSLDRNNSIKMPRKLWDEFIFLACSPER